VKGEGTATKHIREEAEGAEPAFTPVSTGDELAGRLRGFAGDWTRGSKVSADHGNFSFPCFCDESCGRCGENILEDRA